MTGKQNKDADNKMTIHAIEETELAEENEGRETAQAVFRKDKPNKKRANGNVVRRRKRSTPIFGIFQPQQELFREQARRSSSLKYYTTRNFNNDVKMSPFVPVQTKYDQEQGPSLNQKPKKTKGLRRTSSMPSFQKQIKEEDGRICEGKDCGELPIANRRVATKICHHTDCQAQNEMNPVFLCSDCDENSHTGSSSAHLRFDLPDGPSPLQRKCSVRSNDSDSGTEEDSDVSYRFDKKNRSYSSARRFFNIAASKNRGRLKKIQSFDQPQDSVKDCFTLQFYDNDENLLGSKEVPVRKGRSIKESVEPLLDQRGLSFKTHSVFLDSSKTPLPLAFDTMPLAGNIVHVKANEGMKVDERIVELMNNSDDQRPQNQRQKKNIISMITNDDGSSNPKSLSLPNHNASKLTRKTGIHSSARDLTKSLPDLLQQFSVSGFDGVLPENVDGNVSGDEEDELEKRWTDVIVEDEEMTRQQRIQQEAIWELLSTENNYVGKIKVILQVFQKCLYSLQREHFLKEVDSEKVFSNIEDVYHTNHVFWNEYLRQVVEEARRTKEPIKPSQLLDSFAKFEDLFEPYIRYCLEESKCVEYVKHLRETNDNFAEYLAWCENQSQCHRLKLDDLLVKPMQRVTKYRLLLKAVLTRTIDTDEILSLENMISQVERFVNKINTTLRLRHEEQKLMSVLNRLEHYSPIETTEEVDRIIAEYSTLDLRQKVPGLPDDEPRFILLDGPMKMIEKQGRLDVQVFLFTDLLLITKVKKNGEKFRIIRPPYRLNKLCVHQSKDFSSFVLVYLNEFGVVVTAFTLQVASTELTKWLQAITKAKKSYENARLGHGTTLDFFDDDLPPSSISVPSLTSMSPLSDRRGIASSLNDENNLMPPTIVKENDLPLRSSSSSNFTRPHGVDDELQEASVKRSMSDPKTSVHPRARDKRNGKQTKARPMSMIQTSEKDSVQTWMFNEEKRVRSGSIPSDMSDDSRRSSGIGDSFRSINSDGGVSVQRDSIKGSSSFSEVHSVQRLKKRFENGDYHSDSCSSLASNSTHNDPSKPISRSNSNKKSNPDLTEHQHIIHEEEEIKIRHPVHREENNVVVVSDVHDSTRTIQADDVHDEDDEPYQNITLIKNALQKMKLNTYTQTDDIVCEKCAMQTTNNSTLSLTLTREQFSSNTDLQSCIDASTCYDRPDVYDVSTFTADDGHYSVGDVGVQCEILKIPLTKSVSSQCGDFIQLSGVCETESETDHPSLVRNSSQLFYSVDSNDGGRGSNPPSPMPMLNVLTQSLPERSYSLLKSEQHLQRGILKSFSDVDIPLLNENNFKVDHSRSRSEPRRGNHSPKQNFLSNEYEQFPGMRALMNLSESLESTVKRSSSGGNKQTILSNLQIQTVEELEGENMSNIYPTPRSNPSSPPSRKMAIMNNTPATNGVPPEPIKRKVSEVAMRTSPKQLPKSKSDHALIHNKRYTWHDFNSKALLQDLHDTKYGRDKKTGSMINERTIQPLAGEHPKRIERTFSKSTDQLNSPRKQKSFKKSILKKFSDSRILERDDLVVTSASDTSGDSKQMKKQLEKEKKEEKKRVKMEKKLEKKEKKKSSKRKDSSPMLLSSHSRSQSSVIS